MFSDRARRNVLPKEISPQKYQGSLFLGESAGRARRSRQAAVGVIFEQRQPVGHTR
jgi:hypothetical protein